MLFVVALACIFGWVILLLIFYSRAKAVVRRKRSTAALSELPALSIVVCARNEELSIGATLRAILGQVYPSFEVVVVDDRSTDGTRSIIEQYQAKDSRIKLVVVPKQPVGWAGKKWALRQGIEAATHKHLLLTDADCSMGPSWARAMAQAFTPGIEVVLGLSPIRQTHSAVNAYARSLNLWHAAQLLAGIGLKLPLFAIGRNMAYTKVFYKRSTSNIEHHATPSGDDDIPVNRSARASEIAVVTEADALVWTHGPTSWRAMFEQRRRHIGASWHYTWQSQLLLGVVGLLDICLVPSVFVLLTYKVDSVSIEVLESLTGCVALLAARQLVIAEVIDRLAEANKRFAIWLWLGGFEIVHWAFTVALALSLPFKKKSW